jgi:hypothetical protein
MSQALFGTGLLALTQNVSSGTPTPVQVAVLQDVSLDISFKTVDLLGNLQFPVDKAKGEGKISGKFKTGYFAGGLIQAILSGGTSAVGNTQAAFAESHAIPSNPYQVTVTNSAQWVADLAVFDVTSNAFKTKVASGPAAGQYSVAAGVYTFAAADTGHTVQISYDYTAAAVGTTITYINQMMGQTTSYQLNLFNQYQAASSAANSAPGAGLMLPAVVLAKTSLPFKNTGFVEYDIDFEAYANAAGQVIYLYTGN